LRPPWRNLPPTPREELPWTSRLANGVAIAYAELGQGPPLLLLHGGYANGDYWGLQARALSRRHRVIVIDTRGHGRSDADETPFSYDLFASDVLGLVDLLGIRTFSVAGWSDGGIVALCVALREPDRVTCIFALGVNASPAGLIDAGGRSPVFEAYRLRTSEEYAALSVTGIPFEDFRRRMHQLGDGQPDWIPPDLARISARTVVAIGDHDEVIRRQHAGMMARAMPDARLLVLPATSHFALIQAPALVTAAILDLLDGR